MCECPPGGLGEIQKIDGYEKLESDLLEACKKAVANKGIEGAYWKVQEAFKKGFDKAHKGGAGDYYRCLFNNHYFKKEHGFDLPNIQAVEAMFIGFEELKNRFSNGGGAEAEFFFYNAFMDFKELEREWKELPVFEVNDDGEITDEEAVPICSSLKRGNWDCNARDREDAVSNYKKSAKNIKETLFYKPV